MHQCYIKKSISLRLFAFFKCLETLSTRGWPTSRCRGELGALLPTPRGEHWKQVGRIFCTGSEFIPAISGWQTDLQIDRLIQRQLAARSWLVHLSSPVSPMSIEAPPAPFTCHCHRLRRGCWLTFAYKAADMAISIAIANAKREMRKISSSSSRIVATYFKCQTSKLHTGLPPRYRNSIYMFWWAYLRCLKCQRAGLTSPCQFAYRFRISPNCRHDLKFLETGIFFVTTKLNLLS